MIVADFRVKDIQKKKSAVLPIIASGLAKPYIIMYLYLYNSHPIDT